MTLAKLTVAASSVSLEKLRRFMGHLPPDPETVRSGDSVEFFNSLAMFGLRSVINVDAHANRTRAPQLENQRVRSRSTLSLVGTAGPADDQEKRTEAPLPKRSLSLNRMLDLERPVKKDDLTGKPRAAG